MLRPRPYLVTAGVATSVLTMTAPASAALAKPANNCDHQSKNTYQKLLDCMTVDGVREQQDAICGGTAGEQFDPCYHLACDTFENISIHALDVNSDLIAYAMLTFAYSTESVNGVDGKKVAGPKGLGLVAPAGPREPSPRRTAACTRRTALPDRSPPRPGARRDPHREPNIASERPAWLKPTTQKRRRPLPGKGLLVGEGGLEPPHPFEYWHLKPARLPFRHSPEWR